MSEIPVHGRITSGVKMMNLDEGVKIARIAKVREKISDGDQEFDDIDSAEQKMEEEKANMPHPAASFDEMDDEDEDDDKLIMPKEEDEE